MISGARIGQPTWLRRLVARAAAARLTAFVVPDTAIARAAGLDLAAAGLTTAPTPRHASLLVVIGDLPAGLTEAAATAYAQMARPRAILRIGGDTLAALPAPDVTVAPDQPALIAGVAALRRRFAAGAWAADAPPFDLDVEIPDPGMGGHDHHLMSHTAHDMHAGMAMDDAPSGADMHAGHQGMEANRPAANAPMPNAMPHDMTHHGHDQSPPEQQPAEAMDHAAMGHAIPPAPTAPAADDPAAARAPMHHDRHAAMDHAQMHHGAHGGGDHGGRTPAPGTDPHAHHHVHPTAPPPASTVPTVQSDRDTTPAPTEHNAHAAHAGHDHHHPAETAALDDHHAAMDHAAHRAQPHDHAMAHGEMPMPAQHGEHHHAMAHGGREMHAQHGDHGAHAGHGEMEPMQHGDHRGHADHGGMGTETDMQMQHGGHDAHAGHGGMEPMQHGGHGGHGGMAMGGGFMSMVAMTQGLPRSADGLPMEWVEAPFGPLFPGLPGGLALTLTLDGDTVAAANVTPGTVQRGLAATWPGPAATFPDRLALLDPHTPVAYRVLALRALEDAAGVTADAETARRRVGALERERAASHLNWLAGFASLLGDDWIAARAAALHVALVRLAVAGELPPLQSAVAALARRIRRTPFRRRRLAGVGAIPHDDGAPPGPCARAAGNAADARTDDPAYRALGFAPVVHEGGDAWARLNVRLDELLRSLDLVRAAGALALSDGVPPPVAGSGGATIETPRGPATLHLMASDGSIHHAHLAVPSARLLAQVPVVATGREVADALLGIASLDLSPWEVDQ